MATETDAKGEAEFGPCHEEALAELITMLAKGEVPNAAALEAYSYLATASVAWLAGVCIATFI
jgi:hypothetical protein